MADAAAGGGNAGNNPVPPPPPVEWRQTSVDALMRVHDPSLRLTNKNHTEWLQQVKAHLMRVQMVNMLDCPNPADDAFQVFKGFIAVHVPSSLVQRIQDAATPVAVMRAIAAQYAPSATVHVTTMRKQLSKLQQGSQEPVSNYMERAQAMLRDLHAVGDTTTEAFVVTQLLMGLRADFMDEAKYLTRAGTPQTFEAITLPLCDAERTLIALNKLSYSDDDAALAVYHAAQQGCDSDDDAAGEAYLAGGQGVPPGKRRRGSGPARPGAGLSAAPGGPCPRVGLSATPGGQRRGLRTLQLPAEAESLSNEQLQAILAHVLRQGRGGGSGSTPARTRTCYRCNQPGHIAVECKAILPGDQHMPAAARGAASNGGAAVAHFATSLAPVVPGPVDGAAAEPGNAQVSEHIY